MRVAAGQFCSTPRNPGTTRPDTLPQSVDAGADLGGTPITCCTARRRDQIVLGGDEYSGSFGPDHAGYAGEREDGPGNTGGVSAGEVAQESTSAQESAGRAFPKSSCVFSS